MFSEFLRRNRHGALDSLGDWVSFCFEDMLGLEILCRAHFTLMSSTGIGSGSVSKSWSQRLTYGDFSIKFSEEGE